MRIGIKAPTAVFGFALMLLSGSVSAHHALIAEFDLKQSISLRGTLTKLEWINPHGWIYLDVKGADGKVENWAIETGSPARMQNRGLKRTDFQPGMDLIVLGYAARTGKNRAAGWMVTFPELEGTANRESSFPLGR
jgi:hypothetical protein